LADARRDDRDRSRRMALGAEAVALAERLGDPATLLRALTGRWIAAEGPGSILEQADADRMVALALELGDKEQEFLVRELRLMSVWNVGDRAGVDVELEAMAALAGELRQKPQRWIMLTLRAVVALMEGRQDDAGRLIDEAASLGGLSRWNTAVSERLARFALYEQQGRLGEIADVIDRSVREFPALLRFRCAQAHVSAAIGREEDARAQLAALRALDLRHEHVDAEWLFSLCLLPDVCARLGDATAALELHSLLAPHAGHYALAPVEAAFGSVARALGVLAATAGRPEAAVEHYEAAIAIERRMRAAAWLERAERELAAMG
jgi:tetratricopeptide (TPR) repeat protein